jgi:integrase/recombinase XerD
MAKKRSEIVPGKHTVSDLLPKESAGELASWFTLYMEVEGLASADNTGAAKRRDLQAFLDYFTKAVGTDKREFWTRSITEGFMKALAKSGKKPTTMNRVLATLKHAASWIHRHEPFPAGNPCERVKEVSTDSPEWKGLSDIQLTRLRAACDLLVNRKAKQHQKPIRDRALFLLLLHTGLRVSELLSLDLAQYQGKHLCNIKRKGKKVTARVFLAQEAREALDLYLTEIRGRGEGPLFVGKERQRMTRQNANLILSALAREANKHLPAVEKIRLTPHLLRHTMLRRAAEKFGVQYAMELSGHTSSNYIWRYVQPSVAEKERALESLF